MPRAQRVLADSILVVSRADVKSCPANNNLVITAPRALFTLVGRTTTSPGGSAQRALLTLFLTQPAASQRRRQRRAGRPSSPRPADAARDDSQATAQGKGGTHCDAQHWPRPTNSRGPTNLLPREGWRHAKIAAQGKGGRSHAPRTLQKLGPSSCPEHARACARSLRRAVFNGADA